MRKFYNILVAEIKLHYWDIRKYPIKSIIHIAFLVFIIVGFYWGAGKIKGISVEEINTSLLVGYVIFVTAFTIPLLFPAFISSGIENGTLEQVCLSPIKLEYLLLSKVIFRLIYTLITATILLYLIMFFTKHWISINLIHFYLLLLLSQLSLFGVGLVFAGLELRYRKFATISIFFSFGMGGLLALPAYPINVLSFFPFLPGAYTLIKAIAENQKFPLLWYVFLFLNNIFYFILGLFVFRYFEKKARRMNKLGQY